MACSVLGGDRSIPGGALNGALSALSASSIHSFDHARRFAHSRHQRTAIAILAGDGFRDSLLLSATLADLPKPLQIQHATHQLELPGKLSESIKNDVFWVKVPER